MWRENVDQLIAHAAQVVVYFCLACIVQFILRPFSFCTGLADGVPFLLAGLVEDDANFSWHDELEAWLD